MSRRAVLAILALVAAFHLGGAAASAQTITAQVDFPFVVAGKDVPAGRFSVEMPMTGPVVFTGPGGSRIILAVVTSLGRHDRDADAEFVFDKVGGKLILSEVWAPNRDGLLLVATKEQHEHAVVGGSNPRR